MENYLLASLYLVWSFANVYVIHINAVERAKLRKMGVSEQYLDRYQHTQSFLTNLSIWCWLIVTIIAGGCWLYEN